MHAGRRFHCFQQTSGDSDGATEGRWVCDAAGFAFDVGPAADLPDRAAIENAAIKAYDAARPPQ
ncbi:MAG TPA: hypothetical protein VKA84_12790 [Gemmatimonadaceae bacterium]|nr:hypothetical protein [Gemmatimonadaceae bacterium]